MNKRLKKLMLLLLVGILSLSTALAEVKYGSQGDEVKQLQMKLYNMGFMDEKPDGVFGAKTQAGVKALQRYLGAEETGVADEGTLNDLGLLWNMAIGVEEEPGAPIDDSGYPAHCAWTEEETVSYCARHVAAYPVQLMLSVQGAPERLERLLATQVSMLWSAAINDMYDELEESLGWREKHTAQEQRTAFREAMVQQRTALEAEHGKATAQAQLAEMAWLESQGVALCMQLHGEEAHGE